MVQQAASKLQQLTRIHVIDAVSKRAKTVLTVYIGHRPDSLRTVPQPGAHFVHVVFVRLGLYLYLNQFILSGHLKNNFCPITILNVLFYLLFVIDCKTVHRSQVIS